MSGLVLSAGNWLLAAAMFCAVAMTTGAPLAAQVAVRAERLYLMAGQPIEDGLLLIKEGKIAAIGKAGEINVPEGFETLTAKIATPGLVDAHSTVGFSGILNIDHDQDQLERSAPMQPELRAIDAYNAHEELIAWVRSFGVTTLHTGHAPGELISGQTLIVKTTGNTVDDAVIKPAAAVAVTLTSAARKSEGKSPGTRGKMIAMLRSELIAAREYVASNRLRQRARSPAVKMRRRASHRIAICATKCWRTCWPAKRT